VKLARKGSEAMERRKDARHWVSGTARFRLKGMTEASREQTGTLRNVSKCGLFVETADPPPVGTEILIQFEFDSPGKRPAVSIKTKGHVSRVELDRAGGSKRGFAVSTGTMKLHKISGTSS